MTSQGGDAGTYSGKCDVAKVNQFVLRPGEVQSLLLIIVLQFFLEDGVIMGHEQLKPVPESSQLKALQQKNIITCI